MQSNEAFVIGEDYRYPHKEFTGRITSRGTLERFIGTDKAEMYNPRWGYAICTIEDLKTFN